MQAPGQLQGGSGEGSEGWEALVQSQATFNRVRAKVPEKVPGKLWCRANRIPEKVPEKVWEAVVQSQVRFNRVPEKVLEPVEFPRRSGRLRCRAGSGSTGLRRRFRRRSGRLWCRARSGSILKRVLEEVPEKVCEAVQSQVRFNRVLEKVPERLWCRRVPEKVPEGAEPGQVGRGGFGAEPGQVQQGSGEGSGEGLGGFGAEPGYVQQGSGEG